MASVQGHGVVEHVLSHLDCLVSAVDQPTVGLHEDGWAEVLLLVPPVGWAGGGAAGAQDALVQTVQLLTVVDALQDLLAVGWEVLSVQVWFYGLVLLVEVCQVGDKVPDDVHVWQRVDLGLLGLVLVDLAQTGKGVAAANVHGTGAADTLSAGSSEGQRGILLVLDLQQRVQDHGTTVVQVDLVRLQLWLDLRGVWVPTVDLEGLESWSGSGSAARGSRSKSPP